MHRTNCRCCFLSLTFSDFDHALHESYELADVTLIRHAPFFMIFSIFPTI